MVDDTDAEAAAVLLEGWRTMSVRRRMALVEAWSRDVRSLAEAGVRARHPELDGIGVQVAIARLLYGPDVVTADVERTVRDGR